MSWLPADCDFDLGDVRDSTLHIFKACWVGICVGDVIDG